MEDIFGRLKELMLLGGIDGDELIRRHREFSEVSIPNAKIKRVSFLQKKAYYVAASVTILLLIGGGILIHFGRNSVRPALSKEVELAMDQSRKLGKQEASVKVLGADSIAAVTGANESILEKFSESRKIMTDTTKEYWITLDDGTVVHLNNDTYLIYPENTKVRTREVILDGEAYFMVAKDQNRSFIVHTRYGDITAHGTEFNVSTREEQETTEVVLVEGSVSVAQPGGVEMHIDPGQKATIGKVISIEDVDVAQYVAWNLGKFSFQDWPLRRIMKVIAKWYGCTVSFSEDSLGNPLLSGNFDRYEDLSTTIESLEIVTGLQFDVNDGNITIRK
jgi:ferric-dicitrate binding protein FerR (iron transport regulator)